MVDKEEELTKRQQWLNIFVRKIVTEGPILAAYDERLITKNVQRHTTLTAHSLPNMNVHTHPIMQLYSPCNIVVIQRKS